MSQAAPGQRRHAEDRGEHVDGDRARAPPLPPGRP